jgi:hypothetical protein
VEVDLSQGMMSALTGVGKAALQGAAEALAESADGHDGAVRLSAEHLQAIDTILETAIQVVQEVRVRVYESAPENVQSVRQRLLDASPSDQGTGWDQLVRVHEGNDTQVDVRAIQQDGAIRGLLVIVAEGDDLIVANVVCELTPEKVKAVTNQATKLGLKVGLADVLQHLVAHTHAAHTAHSAPATR